MFDHRHCRDVVVFVLPPVRQSGKFQLPVDFTHPERELFLWALLLNRRQLAMLFWKLGQDHIGRLIQDSHFFGHSVRITLVG